MDREEEARFLAMFRTLSPDRRREVVEFIEYLERVPEASDRPVSLMGVFAHAGVHLSAEAIDAERREAWGEFPRPELP